MKTNFNRVLTLFTALIMQISFAQEKTISGTVSDDIGGLPGVTVFKKGTTRGTETDFDGKFSIKANVGDTLVFSYVGMKTVENIVGTASIMDVVMIPTDLLDEIIIVGYGTQSKRKLTDNIIKLDSEDIKGVPTPNVFNSLASKATGVQIRQTNGKIEGGLSFRIRGQSSIGAGTNPLYVLDGIPLINNDESNNNAPTNPLLTLNPNEIESIDILKDASSAAIYGSRGANGVVLITTKKGKQGKAKFNINVSNGISEASNKRDWLNAEQYVDFFLEAAANSDLGNLTGFLQGSLDGYSNNTDWRNGEIDTDWQDIALRQGYTRDLDFSVNGADEKTNYFLSASYNDTKGIVLGNDLERIGGRINLNHKFSDRFTVGANSSISRVEIDRVDGDGSVTTPLQAVSQAPISPAYVDGEPFGNTVYPNFLLIDKYGFYKTHVRRFIGNLNLEYKFLNALKFNSSFGYDLFSQTEDTYRGRKTPFQSTNGQANASNVNTEVLNFSNYFTYNNSLEDHSLNIILGAESNKQDRRFTGVEATQFPEEGFQSIDNGALISDGEGNFRTTTYQSYFTRATYSYKDKYLLKTSFRRDGSSRFGEKNRWGNFSSISGGWILSEENFLKDSKWLSFLKLRASYGSLGNAEIRDFSSLNLATTVAYNKISGIAIDQAGDSSLKWESSDQLDLGLEFALFNNRISGEFSYYKKVTDDLLFSRALPGSSGVDEIIQNIGSLENDGIELSITSTNIQTDNFTWKTSINLGQNKNIITELPNNNADQISGQNILRKGEAVNAFYLIEYAGVDPDNGDALYFLNNDGSDDTTNDPNKAQRIAIGNPNPEWIGGFTSNMTYKNFDFSFTFGMEFGASIYNGGGIYQSSNGDWFDNQTVDQLNRWRNPGDITDVPQARLGSGNGTAASTRYLEDGDFIRLRNLSLGYTLPKDILNKAGVDNTRIYLSGLNLFTFTDYKGYDPESRSDTSFINSGQAFYSAPAARTYSLGVNIGF